MEKTTQKWLAVGLVAASAATLSACTQNNTTAQANDVNKPVQTVSNERARNKDTHSEHEGKNSKEASDHAHGEGASHGSTVHTHSTRLRFSSQPSQITAGKSANWTLQIVDNADATPINNFETVHDKKLHLIVVSSDLSYFSHVHPQFTQDGKFVLSKALPRAGTYRLYADYKPQGEEGEVALQEIKVAGANPLPSSTRLVADTMRGGWMTKNVQSHDEGFAPAANATRYQVALMPMPGRIVAGKDVMLHFQVRDASGQPLAKLEPYLGAQGHCVILSSDPQVYLHAHPMSGDHEDHEMGSAKTSSAISDSAKTSETKMSEDHNEMNHSAASSGEQAGADVMFHTNFPKAGLYKVWGQFKHNGKIITAPFVVNVGSSGVR